MGYKIEEVEGIGPSYAQKLAPAGVTNTDHFLSKGATAKGRKELAEATGISEKLILRWANQADLMRISGVGSEYGELLEAAGVDTVKELRTRRADNLAAKMAEVNDAKKLVRQVPSEDTVAKWVEQAKGLEPMITY